MNCPKHHLTMQNTHKQASNQVTHGLHSGHRAAVTISLEQSHGPFTIISTVVQCPLGSCTTVHKATHQYRDRERKTLVAFDRSTKTQLSALDVCAKQCAQKLKAQSGRVGAVFGRKPISFKRIRVTFSNYTSDVGVAPLKFCCHSIVERVSTFHRVNTLGCWVEEK